MKEIKLSQKEMMEALTKRFPSIVLHDGNTFSKGITIGNGIWIKDGSSVPYTDKDSNPLSVLDTGILNERLYDIDVYKKFDKWCTKRGWYPTTEDYTLMLYKL